MSTDRLTEALFVLYTRMGKEVTYRAESGEVRPYWANRYRQALQRAVDEDAVIEFVERLVSPAAPSRGFGFLVDASRLDLSVEALVAEEFSDLFKPEIVRICRDRLVEFGYEPNQRSADPTTSPFDGVAERLSDAMRGMSDGGLAIDVRVRIMPDGTVSFQLL